MRRRISPILWFQDGAVCVSYDSRLVVFSFLVSDSLETQHVAVV